MSNTPNPILMDIPVPIETERLIIRPAQAGDGAALHEAKQETWDDLHQWMPWAKTKSTLDEDEITCREAYIKFLKREDMMMFAFEKDTGRWVTATGIHRFDWSVRRFEIGYWTRKSAWGKGYAGEVTNALTRYAFSQLKANAVMIGHAAGNEKSRRVIEKIGFDLEGAERRSTSGGNGDVYDACIYSRLNTDGLPPLNVTWEGSP